MLLLLLFAVLAGAGTAITPCVLPVLPALLSASAVGGRRRPIGIVLGLAVTFTLAIVALAQLVKGVGLASGAARDLAIVVLIGFGLTLLVPQLAQRIQAPLSRLARFGPKTRGDGFISGLGVGAALGFICAPCAGPILSAVIGVSASTGPTVGVVATAIAYSLGLSAMLLLYGFGGRVLLGRIRRAARGHIVEQALGVILLLTGVALIFNLDTRLDEFIAKHQRDLPGFLFDPTQQLEQSKAGQKAIASIRPESHLLANSSHAKTPAADATVPQSVGLAGVTTPPLKDLAKAPNFTNTEQWFNTPQNHSLSISSLKGKVVLVDFWTYTCINCIRTLPFVEGLYAHYHQDGLVVVGVETPEFTFEQEAANVSQAIKSDGITYPVVQDNQYGTWNAYDNQSWPAEYLIDATGEIRHVQIGEGDYKQDEAAVRTLLYEAGDHHLPAPMTAKAKMASEYLGTPETYLDPQRAQAEQEDFVQPLQMGAYTYNAPSTRLSVNEFELQGTWTANDQSITPTNGTAYIAGGIQARDVYLVMTSANNTPRKVRVFYNGKPITSAEAGTNVGPGGYVTVSKETVYNLVALKDDERFSITVQVPKGVSAYDFTFG